jgi:hypothetical protein
MPVTRNTGATDNWIALARPITGACSGALGAPMAAARLIKTPRVSELIKGGKDTDGTGRLARTRPGEGRSQASWIARAESF